LIAGSSVMLRFFRWQYTVRRWKFLKLQQRGCQLSLFFHRGGQSVIQQLRRSGVVVDWREPNVMRVAPVPLYNTFEEVFRFGTLLEQVKVIEEG